jgi:hypothetical protein
MGIQLFNLTPLAKKFTSCVEILSEHTAASVDALVGKGLDRTGQDIGVTVTVGSSYYPITCSTAKGQTASVFVQKYNKGTDEDGTVVYEIANTVPEMVYVTILRSSTSTSTLRQYVRTVVIDIPEVDDAVLVPISGSVLTFHTNSLAGEMVEKLAKAFVYMVADDPTEYEVSIAEDSGDIVVLAGIVRPEDSSDLISNGGFTVDDPFTVVFEQVILESGYVLANLYIDNLTGAVVIDYGDESETEEGAAAPDLRDGSRYFLLGVILLFVDSYENQVAEINSLGS